MQSVRNGTDFNELIFHRRKRGRGTIPPAVVPLGIDLRSLSLRGHVLVGTNPFTRWLCYHHNHYHYHQNYYNEYVLLSADWYSRTGTVALKYFAFSWTGTFFH